MNEKSTPKRGFLIPIGGAEDRSENSPILSRVLQYFGGKDARIVIIPTASQQTEKAFEHYADLFKGLGAASVDSMNPSDRVEANAKKLAQKLDQASGVFLTGGNQVRLSSILGGTLLSEKLKARFAEGVSVAGTSAGASIQCQHMIAYGKSGSAPRLRMLQMAPGFGLIESVIIDQHFRQRHRIGRLQTAVSLNPRLLGVGLDENTAAVIRPDNTLEVFGAGAATIIDGSQMLYSDVYKIKPRRPVAMVGMIMHVLTEGLGYNIETREPKLQAVGKSITSGG